MFYSICIWVSSITRWERIKGTGKKTGQEVIFIHSLPVEEAEKVRPFNCLLVLLAAVVGPPKYRDLKFCIDRWLKTHVIYLRALHNCSLFEAGAAEWLDCGTRKWKISVDLDLNDGRIWIEAWWRSSFRFYFFSSSRIRSLDRK